MNQFPDVVSRRGLVGMPYNIYLRVARNGCLCLTYHPGDLPGKIKLIASGFDIRITYSLFKTLL